MKDFLKREFHDRHRWLFRPPLRLRVCLAFLKRVRLWDLPASSSALSVLGMAATGLFFFMVAGTISSGTPAVLGKRKHTEWLGKEFDAFFGDEVVTPVPAEDVFEVVLRSEWLGNHHDLDVRNVGQLGVDGHVSVLKIKRQVSTFLTTMTPSLRMY